MEFCTKIFITVDFKISNETDFTTQMLILFSIFEIELNNTTDIIISLIDGKFESLSFFVSIFEDFLIDFFIKCDLDINRSSKTSKEA